MTDFELIDALQEEGFTMKEIEEIFAYLGCGHSLDSAMQLVMDR